MLTLYQTTNFRLFQTERVCRRQFQIWRKWQKVIQMGKKTLWEKEKLLITSNFSFSQGVFKMLVSQGRQKVSLCGNGLTLNHTIVTFGVPEENASWKHCAKKRKCWWPAFTLFPHNVFYSIKDKFHHLTQDETCLQMLPIWARLNPFLNKPSTSLEKTLWEKGEIACNEQFLLLPQCFLTVWRTFCHFHPIWNSHLQSLSFWKSLKFVVWERVQLCCLVKD